MNGVTALQTTGNTDVSRLKTPHLRKTLQNRPLRPDRHARFGIEFSISYQLLDQQLTVQTGRQPVTFEYLGALVSPSVPARPGHNRRGAAAAQRRQALRFYPYSEDQGGAGARVSASASMRWRRAYRPP